MTTHRRGYTQLPARRPRRSGRPTEARDAVMEEQNAASDVLNALHGDQAIKLNPDGKRGPATNGIRDMLNSAFRDFPPNPANRNETPAQRFRRIADFLKSEDGQKWRTENDANVQGLQAKAQELYDTRPPNGFVPRGDAPAPGVAPERAPGPDGRPAEATPPVVRAPGDPETIPPGEDALQGRDRYQRESARPQGVIPSGEMSMDMGRRIQGETIGGRIPTADPGDVQIVDLSVGAPRSAAPAVVQPRLPAPPAPPTR